MSSTDAASSRKPIPVVDFDLDDFDADEDVLLAFDSMVGVGQDMLTPLATHHSADGVHSYYVLFDGSVTWGIPGAPQLMALHLQRDRDQRTFSFEGERLPLPSMAQSWLIHRGCPPDAIGLDPELGPPAADEATRALERRLAGDGDHFAMGYSYTRDDPDDMLTVVALRALDERAPSPFRVLVEEVDTDAWTHTLREGGFDTKEEALHWCFSRLDGEAGSLPAVRPTVAATRPAGLPKGPAVHPSGRTR
ncbi:hypothetical protein [Streptomyces fradiae]|uniref:hypothetical protein n=1 Tax=Streptomyces fradiae TaxID=1906 RepID=UPI003986F220